MSRSKLKRGVFFSHLARLLQAQVPLIKALALLEQQGSQRSAKVLLGKLREQVEAGEAFAEALAKYPRQFPDFQVEAVRTGEAAGALAEVLRELADYERALAEARRNFQRALLYPAVVLAMAGLLILFMSFVLVPRFEAVYQSMSQIGELPLLTRLVVGSSRWLTDHVVAVAVSLGIIGLLAGWLRRNPKLRFAAGRLLLRVPVAGEALRHLEATRYCRALALLLRGGAPILAAATQSGRVVRTEALRREFGRVPGTMAAGATLFQALDRRRPLPSAILTLIGVGEETGEIEDALETAARHARDEVIALSSTLQAVLQPLIIIVLAVVVGLTLAALFLPMLPLYESLGAGR